VTSEILFSAQKYTDEMNIPRTEWTITGEISEVVLDVAKKYAKLDKWELYH
jgi:hypothetical protein